MSKSRKVADLGNTDLQELTSSKKATGVLILEGTGADYVSSLDSNGNWLVVKVLHSDGSRAVAKLSNNPSQTAQPTTLTAAVALNYV